MSRTRSLSLLVASAVALGAAAGQASAQTPAAAVTAAPSVAPLTAKPRVTTITVRNTTKRPLTRATVVVGTRKGVRVTLIGSRAGVRTRTLPTLRPGQRVTLRVRLARVGKAGPSRGALPVTLRRGSRVLGRTNLIFGRRPTAAPIPAPLPAKTLAGRHFWGSKYTLNGTRQHTLLFTGPNLVFVGEPEGAWPSCTAVSEDCKPYTFDPASGAVTIDGQPATLAGNKLTLDGQTHWELGQPKAGARWDLVLTYANSSGICPLYCNYYTEHLTFRPDGTFIRSSVASGSGPVVDWAVVPDASKGHYEVRADRTLRLAFADGKERIHTLGLFPADDNSYPANPTAGAVLDNDGYFDIRD